jgi:hypothetical protein
MADHGKLDRKDQTPHGAPDDGERTSEPRQTSTGSTLHLASHSSEKASSPGQLDSSTDSRRTPSRRD